MELRHLRYFVAVAEALSFTKAAQKLGLAQPSLTRQVRNLEDEIGARLLDRGNNKVALTEEGRAFLSDARKVLAMCAESVASVRRISRGESFHLNVGYVANVHYDLLPGTFGAFRKLYPRMTLNLFDMSGAQQIHALLHREIDIGFVGLRPESSSGDLLSECIGHEAIVVALAHRHPLAKKPRLKLADLEPNFFIAMSPATHPGAREWLMKVCERSGFVASVLQEAEGEPAAIKFVADGLGVALLPKQMTEHPREGVVFCPLVPPLLQESTISWRADNHSKPLQEYIRIVKAVEQGLRGCNPPPEGVLESSKELLKAHVT
jgi:DNA-binding transcriptional LysR family regulator